MSFDDLKIWITLINLFLVPLLSGAVYSLIESIKKRKLKIFLESQELIDKLDDDFKNSFIDPSKKEILFYLHTGILTNAKSIPRFVELKDKLGRNYTWKQIKLVKAHVNVSDLGPLLHLNKTLRYTSTVTNYLFLSFVAISILEFAALSIYMDDLPPAQIISLILYIILPLLAALIFMNQTASISTVKVMMKILENQEQQGNVDNETANRSLTETNG